MKTILTLALISTFSTLVSAMDVPQLQCSGTEPFWGIKTDAKGFLSMSDPMAKKFYSKTVAKNALGMTEGFAFQIEAQDMNKNVLKLNVVKSECSDGMSDEVYPYTALVDVDGKILFGCCR